MTLDELARIETEIIAVAGLSPMLMGHRVNADGLPIPEPTTSGEAVSNLMSMARVRLYGHTLTKPPPPTARWIAWWAGLYLLGSHPFARGFGYAMALGVLLAFITLCLTLAMAMVVAL